jgi:hypothetical protein
VRIYTAHIHPTRPPVLVREGFSWAAAIFGALWLFFHRAWIAGVLALCAAVLLGAMGTMPLRLVLELALAWALGLFGQDLRRWSLARQGYLLAHIVAGADEDAALARLLARRPDLTELAVR